MFYFGERETFLETEDEEEKGGNERELRGGCSRRPGSLRSSS